MESVKELMATDGLMTCVLIKIKQNSCKNSLGLLTVISG